MKSYKRLLLVLWLVVMLGLIVAVLIIEPTGSILSVLWSQLHSDVLAFLNQHSSELIVAIISTLIGAIFAFAIARWTERRREPYDREMLRLHRRREARDRGVDPDFPFDIVTVENLCEKLGILPIPYVERQSAEAYQELMAKWNERKALLIQGRGELGKRREAIELIRKLQEAQGERYTVLIPHDNMDKPTSTRYLTKLESPNVILFVPDGHECCQREESQFDIGEPLDFQERLRTVIAYFEDICKRRHGDFRAIVTVDSTPGEWEKIRPQHVVWQRFHRHPLKDFIGRTSWAFIEAAKDYLQIELEQAAQRHLHRTHQGAAKDIIVPLMLEKGKSKQEISLPDIQRHDNRQRFDYYDAYIAPYPECVCLSWRWICCIKQELSAMTS